MTAEWHAWQWGLIWLMPIIGSQVGGIFGYFTAREKDNLLKFKWKRALVTLVFGAIAGGLWIWIIQNMHAEWSIGGLIGGMLVGPGVDFLIKKLPME